MMLQLQQLSVPPGQRLLLRDISWSALETILTELGEHRNTRIAYLEGTLELMTPLPEHERAKVILGDLVKALLDERELDWDSLGSTTFRREAMAAGIEPDDCFYIQNDGLVIGKERLDLNIDPPPDLAIEVDLTSKTQVYAYAALGVPEIWQYQNCQLQIYLLQENRYIVSQASLAFPDLPIDPPPDLAIEVDLTSKTQVYAYAALGVPEIWQYQNCQLQIYLLQENRYIVSQASLAFPDLPVVKGISKFAEMSRTQGPRQTLKAFRSWVQQQS